MIRRTLRNSILTADLVWGILAMPIAYLLRYGWVWRGPKEGSALIFIPPLMATLLIWSVMSSWVRLDGFRSGWVASAVVSQILLSVLFLLCVLFALAYLLRDLMSRLVFGYFGLLLFSGFLAIRLIARGILASRRARGLNRKIVIVGNGPIAREMVNKICGHPEMLQEVVGFLSPGDDACPSVQSLECESPMSVQSSDVIELLEARGVDEIVLTVPTPGHPDILDLTSRCRTRGIAVSAIPQPYELYITKHELTDLDGLPLLQLVPASPRDIEPFWKRVFDLCAVLVLIPVCLAPMLAAAAILKLKKGHAFSSERRFGKNGVQFTIYRLNSPRTGKGLPWYEHLFQNLSVTELPQLFNVLRGDMSLVGPRPEGIDRVRRYTEWSRRRLRVKPGITGLAQVHGLRHQHSSEDKTRYDLQYILHRSLFQDISLLLQTAWTIVARVVRPGGPVLLPADVQQEDSDLTFQRTMIHAHSSQSSAD